MSRSHLKPEYEADSFNKIEQVEYNNAMIEYKNNKPSTSWLNPFRNTNDKPKVPENGFDVSDWDIKTIEEYTEFLAKNNSPVKNTNNISSFKYTNSNTLENLEKTLTELENDLKKLEGDGRYDNDGTNTLRPFSHDTYINHYNTIDNKIKNIKKQIKDEKDRLKKMSRGGKSRTKQHYRNKSNKRKSRKSKKSKRKSIKK
jgi:hypothetical protein